jgi:hypothetical protein
MCGRQERCIQGFGEADLRDKDHFDDPGADGGIILKWVFKRGNGET